MSIPFSANQTCDVYHTPNAPPAAPDVAAVSIYLRPDWVRGQEAGDRAASSLTWTHIMLVDGSVDVRDYYGGDAAGAQQDDVYIPDQNGTRFKVVFIEKIAVGTALYHKRVYLDRRTPTWPSNNL